VLALTRAADVDDVRVLRPDVVEVDLQLRADARELVCEEDVARRRDLVEDLEPLLRGQVEPEALLAPVRVLEQHVHAAAERHDAARRKASHGVTALDVLDLDHLGAPLREQRRRGGHERVLGDLEHTDALHDCGQRSPRVPACPLRTRRRA
jgi:hypothetical protein